jgi:hypothetical protein
VLKYQQLHYGIVAGELLPVGCQQEGRASLSIYTTAIYDCNKAHQNKQMEIISLAFQALNAAGRASGGIGPGRN